MRRDLITEELIQQFFEGRCDDRDKAIVEAFFRDNPGKLKEYMGADEWEEFQPSGALDVQTSGKLWKDIQKNTATIQSIYTYLTWTAVAASIIIALGTYWYFAGKKQVFKTNAPEVAVHGSTGKSIYNNTMGKMMLTLPDGSTVDLSPASTLTYPEDFNIVKRAVTIKGEASFSIAKDASKPFMVYNNAVLVTVLGTRFTVKSEDSSVNTKVILQEGSVMINIHNTTFQYIKKEYYLAPGDIFILKKVAKQKSSLHAVGSEALSTDSLTARILHLQKGLENSHVFDNYPLDVVFDQLQLIYNTKIIYHKADLGNRSFIGKIDGKDSLNNVLRSICLLNNFTLRKQGEDFVIIPATR